MPGVTRKLTNLARRNFLVRCCQGAAGAMMGRLGLPLAANLAAQGSPEERAEFHLHPRYRTATALDPALLAAAPDADFPSEQHVEPVQQILARWTASLLESPANTRGFDEVLAAEFRGFAPQPTEARVVRPGPGLEVRRIGYAWQSALSREAFLAGWRKELSSFSKIVTAEFQVTRVDAAVTGLPARVATSVRYEIVGTGQGYYREQRAGHWELEWEARSTGDYRLRRWQAGEETRSRASAPFFADITARSLGRNPSYARQMLRGVDDWRTVLDGASGIDIYGHNGVSVGDIDGDGHDDIYVCQPAGLPNRLYRNRRDGTFEDITEASGTGVLENTACALFADFRNQGRQDLVVVRATGPLLFVNQGGGKFQLHPDAFQFANPPQGTFTGAAAADYDRDGWLDIYFCLYTYYQGADQYKYPVPYFDANNGPPNFLMRNDRDGTFRDATAEAGLDRNNTRYSFCCGWSDYDQDGWPDLYVVNDFGRKNLYHNNGDGTFTDVAARACVEDVGAGMSVSWLDYDNDGAPDIYSADMWTAAGERISMQEEFQKGAPLPARAFYRRHAMGNSLFRNRGDGAFEDRTGAARVGMGRWSWSSDTWDFDHDGFADLYIANGFLSGANRDDLNSFFWRQVVARSPNEPMPSADYEQGWGAVNELIRADRTWSGFERNVFFANNRDGTFSDVSGALGLDFIEDGRSFALADFDHDGRQEVLLKNRNSPQLRLLKNVAERLPPSIAFCLRGTSSNRDAIGAIVTVRTSLGTQVRTLTAGSGFLSQHSKELFFGLGEAKGPVNASIRWPGGAEQHLSGLPVNHRVWVEEGTAAIRTEPFESRTPVVSAPQARRPLPTTAETWLLVPVAAPEFSLADQAGRLQSLLALRGKPVLLYLWTAAAPDSRAGLDALAQRYAGWVAQGLELLAVHLGDAAGGAALPEAGLPFAVLRGSDDTAAVYNLLYRYLFDRHRDLTLPTALLVDAHGFIAKVYQGPLNPESVEHDFRHIPQTAADRLASALPFPGAAGTYEYGRNNLSLGSVFFAHGYLEQAEKQFQLALRDDPSSAEAHYGLGSVYLQQKKTDQARASFERALQLNASYPGTRPNAWNNLGLLATREGRTGDAIGDFQEALRNSPDHLIALENLGNAYRQEKRWGEARAALERALTGKPHDPEANYSLAMVYAQTGDTARAYDYLQKALLERPDYPEALNNLGVLYLRTGRRDAAVAQFEKSILVAPDFDQAYLNLARVYALEGSTEKARAVLAGLLKQHPGHAQARKALDELR
jgi:tetratricopeptide (TPR) repeat protein